MRDRRWRSVAKGVSYRMFGSLTTVAISYAVCGTMRAALSIGLTDVLVKTGMYYVHERAWERISAGRRKDGAIEYQI